MQFLARFACFIFIFPPIFLLWRSRTRRTMRLMQRRGSAHWTMRLRLLRNTRAFRLIRLTSTHFYFYILENLVEFGRCCCCFCVFDTIFGLFANRLKSNFWFCQCYYRFSQVLSRGLLSSLVITFKFYVFIFIFSKFLRRRYWNKKMFQRDAYSRHPKNVWSP